MQRSAACDDGKPHAVTINISVNDFNELKPDDLHYPPRLQVLESAGIALPTLWYRGTLPGGDSLAVVGPRDAPPEALRWVAREVARLARDGIVIWSGGARGIDAAAHRAALEAGGRTVVVTAGPLQQPHPRKHRGLYREVVAHGGAVITQSQHEQRAHYQFLKRNQVLVALSQAVLAVGARAGGGTWHSIQTARKLQRPVLVVPGAPWSKCGAGVSRQLARGGVTAVTSAKDVQRALTRLVWRPTLPLSAPRPKAASGRRDRPRNRPAASQQAAPADVASVALEPDEQRLLQSITTCSQHVNHIARAAQQPVAVVRRTLLGLQLAGQVVEGPAGHFRRIGSIC